MKIHLFMILVLIFLLLERVVSPVLLMSPFQNVLFFFYSFLHFPAPLAIPSTSISDASDHIPYNFPNTSFSPSSQSHHLFSSTSSSSHSPPHLLPPPQPIGHPMVTRSKSGIYKSKTYLSDSLAQPSKPTSVT